MSRISYIPKDENLIKKIKLACNNYENSFGLSRGTARKIIIEKLGLKSTNELNNYFTTYENKYLRIEELFIIIDIFEKEQQKIILDYIANKYNFVLTDSAETTNDNLIPDLSILCVNSVTGHLNQKYFDYKNNDNKLDEVEIENLLHQSYLIRQTLINFENNLRGLLK